MNHTLDKLKEHILKIHNCVLKKGTKNEDGITVKKSKNSAGGEDNRNTSQNDALESTIQSSDSQSSSEQIFEQVEVAKTTKFYPKVPPTDYQRFIYKCHDCLLGFKRRGMNFILFH